MDESIVKGLGRQTRVLFYGVGGTGKWIYSIILFFIFN